MTGDGPPDRTVDLRAETCPMTFVRARLALDAMAPGGLLLVLLAGAEPQARVPRTLMDQGHAVVASTIDPAAPEVLRLLVRKAAAGASARDQA